MKWKEKGILQRLMIVAVILFSIELLFIRTGFLVPIGFASLCMYFGWKKRKKIIWKLVGWLGVIILIALAFELITIRLLFFVLLIWGVVQLSNRKTSAYNVLKQDTASPIQNLVIGHQTTPTSPYVWKDISFNQLIGDSQIDLTGTVLPERECFIVAQQAIGELTVVMPYNVEFSVKHTSLFGETKIVESSTNSNWKQNIYYETVGFQSSTSRVRIITTGFFSRVKVIRG
ncbi:cell wall-active antibiotics response protein LiaF [Mangrovibacillus cuniculi]|uniref:Cell wall-active antibiotics response protein n=1 Tax=Mangrovibacillus cuniculi TaxID=2593652 RepID=A0A7S8C981_9BACI|nr:cell wall-active antibiotics response protein LiaF [Mangrovibacillus cuniculi]QPC45736.1 cell wall-active antibiotics response protein [Mangrovibacillus cuniculi]